MIDFFKKHKKNIYLIIATLSAISAVFFLLVTVGVSDSILPILFRDIKDLSSKKMGEFDEVMTMLVAIPLHITAIGIPLCATIATTLIFTFFKRCIKKCNENAKSEEDIFI